MPSMTPTQRMAALLRRLARAEGRLVSTVELRRLCPDDYGADENMASKEIEARARTFRRDIEHLRRRGFIETGFTALRADMDNRQGVRLRRHVEKNPALHLTPREHGALNRARARLRPGPALVEVLPGRGKPLDVALAVVRYLEEQGTGWASGRHLADILDMPVGRLLAALDPLVENPVRDPAPERPVVDELQVERQFDPVTEEIVGFRVRIAEARSSRRPGRSVSPTYGRGMHHVGRFAYTPVETRERLSLIAEAMEDPETAATDVLTLHRAGDKLRQWHLDLTGQEWAPDAELSIVSRPADSEMS
jgi:hypothetical protein